MPKSCPRAAQMGSPRKHWRYALWDRVSTVFLWWVILTFGLTDQFMQKHQRRLDERVLRGVSGNLQQRIEVAFEEVCREHSKSREEILGESIRLAWPWVQASLIPPLLEFSWVFCDYFQEAVRITPGNLCLNGSKPSGRSAQFAIEHVQNVSNAY